MDCVVYNTGMRKALTAVISASLGVLIPMTFPSLCGEALVFLWYMMALIIVLSLWTHPKVAQKLPYTLKISKRDKASMTCGTPNVVELEQDDFSPLAECLQIPLYNTRESGGEEAIVKGVTPEGYDGSVNE